MQLKMLLGVKRTKANHYYSFQGFTFTNVIDLQHRYENIFR